QLLGRELSQFLIDQRQELLRGVRVTLLDGIQHLSDRVHRQPTTSRTGGLAAGAPWREDGRPGVRPGAASGISAHQRHLPASQGRRAPCSAHVMSARSEEGSGEEEGIKDTEQRRIVAADGRNGEPLPSAVSTARSYGPGLPRHPNAATGCQRMPDYLPENPWKPRKNRINCGKHRPRRNGPQSS